MGFREDAAELLQVKARKLLEDAFKKRQQWCLEVDEKEAQLGRKLRRDEISSMPDGSDEIKAIGHLVKVHAHLLEADPSMTNNALRLRLYLSLMSEEGLREFFWPMIPDLDLVAGYESWARR